MLVKPQLTERSWRFNGHSFVKPGTDVEVKLIWCRDGEDEVPVLVEFSPAFRLGLLQIAVLARKHRHELDLTRWQGILFSLLAPFGRLLGLAPA